MAEINQNIKSISSLLYTWSSYALQDRNDYWLQSDHQASATDLWGTEYC